MAQFQKGQSGNPKGRAPGKTPGAQIREAIEQRKDDILNVVINAAVNGDMQACKMLLDRITPPLKPQAVPVQIPVGETLPDSGANIVTATLAGIIPPDIGSQLISALAAQGKLIELQEMQERLIRIERQLETRK